MRRAPALPGERGRRAHCRHAAMETLPTKANREGCSFTVADFYEAGREHLALELLTGENSMQTRIEEPILNRPGLALTGFFTNFAPSRVQIFGNSETAYLDSLEPSERNSRFRALLAYKPSLLVFTNGARPYPEYLEAASEMDICVMTTPYETRYFTHHSLFLLERLSSPKTTIYGTMIEVCGLGVLLESAPGLGKSETALGLIKRGSVLIADDLTCIRKDTAANILYGSASSSTVGYMEIRGIGIIHVPSIFGIDAVRGEKHLQLVITLKHLDEVRGEVDRIGQRREPKEILGVKIPNVLLPVSEGRDLVNLVETAAQQHKLILAGQDPASKLSMHLRCRASRNAMPARTPSLFSSQVISI